jgi:hypothetical protein
VSCRRWRTQLKYNVSFRSSEQKTGQLRLSQEELAVGEEDATAFAEEDEVDEDRKMRTFHERNRRHAQ